MYIFYISLNLGNVFCYLKIGRHLVSRIANNKMKDIYFKWFLDHITTIGYSFIYNCNLI